MVVQVSIPKNLNIIRGQQTHFILTRQFLPLKKLILRLLATRNLECFWGIHIDMIVRLTFLCEFKYSLHAG
jgi:hypothetical protein